MFAGRIRFLPLPRKKDMLLYERDISYLQNALLEDTLTRYLNYPV